MARVHSSGRLDVVVVERDEAEARIAELDAAMRDIANMKPQIIGDTGFQRDLYSSLPQVLFGLALSALDLLPHLLRSEALVLRAVGENAVHDPVEGFQNLGHAIKSL